MGRQHNEHIFYYPRVVEIPKMYDQMGADDFGIFPRGDMKEKSPEVETELSSLDRHSWEVNTSNYTTDNYSHELGWRNQPEHTEEYLGRLSAGPPPGPPPELPLECKENCECPKH